MEERKKDKFKYKGNNEKLIQKKKERDILRIKELEIQEGKTATFRFWFPF